MPNGPSLTTQFPTFMRQRFPRFMPLGYLLLLCLLIGAHFALARLGLYLATFNQNVSPVWPATGFALASLILLGRRFWPAIAIGTFLADTTTGLVWEAALFTSVGNALEASVGAYVYVWIRKNPLLLMHGHSFATIGATLVGAMLSAGIGLTGLFLYGSLGFQELPSALFTWWVGNVIGGLTLLPLLIELSEVRSFDRRKCLNFLPLLMLGSVLVAFLFISDSGGAYLFLVFPFILLCLHFSGCLASYGASFVLGVAGLIATYYGTGIFQSGNLNSDLIHLQIFLASLSVTALFLPEIWRTEGNRRIAMVLLSSWILAGGIFYSFYSKGRVEIESNVTKLIALARDRLESQGKNYETALKSGVGLFKASVSVERSEWRAFSNEINSLNRESGLLGMGVAFRVPRGDIPYFVQRMREDGEPGFHYQRIGDDPPASDAYIVGYIETVLSTESILGLDLSTETHRREAAERSMRSGQLEWTKGVFLYSGLNDHQGFLVVHPIYRNGAAVDTENARREAHIGWVYCPVDANDFFSSALGGKDKLSLSYTVHEAGSGRLLSRSDDFLLNSDRAKHLRREVVVNLAGQVFHLTLKPSPKFSTSVDLACSLAGATAALIGLLLASLVSTMQSTNVRVEDLVRKRSQELELTSRMAKVGGWSYDLEKDFLVFSPVAKDIFSLGRDEVPSLRVLIRSLRDAELRQTLERRLLEGDDEITHWDSVVEMTNEQGISIWVRIIGLRGQANGSSRTYYGTIQDITEQKQREIMLMQSSKMASLGEMAAGVAHEINSPLMIISGMAYRVKQMLAKGPCEPQLITKQMDDIDVTVKRIANIIKGLRTFSRNAENDPLEMVSLKSVIEDTLVLCMERFKNKGIALEVEPIPDILIRARSTQISQVLLNLLNNSYDSIAERQKPWVRISFEIFQGRELAVRVTDSGEGIPSALADRIMQPFFSTKEVGKGTGIGLSISKGIALSHSGDLTLDRGCKNTSFILSLPLEVAS